MKKYKFIFNHLAGIYDTRNVTDDLLNDGDVILTCQVESNNCNILYSKHLIGNVTYLSIDQLREIISLGTLKTNPTSLQISPCFDTINYNIHIEFTEEEAIYLSMKYGNIYNFSKAFIYE